MDAKATGNSTVYQQIVQANNYNHNHNNINNKYKTLQAPHYWSCVRGDHRAKWFLFTKGQQ